MSMFTLAISCLTMSNILIHGPNNPCFYAILFFTALDFTFITSTTESCFLSGPAASFFLELLVTALCSFPVVYWTPSDLWGPFSGVKSFFPFHTVHRVLLARILEWVVTSSSSGLCFVRTFHYDPSVLSGPAQHGS